MFDITLLGIKAFREPENGLSEPIITGVYVSVVLDQIIG